MINKKNMVVTSEYLAKRHAISKALTDCTIEALKSENAQLVGVLKFETTKFLGGRSNMFPLTDPYSLFIGYHF